MVHMIPYIPYIPYIAISPLCSPFPCVPYIPISPYIPLYLPISPYIPLYPPISPYIPYIPHFPINYPITLINYHWTLNLLPPYNHQLHKFQEGSQRAINISLAHFKGMQDSRKNKSMIAHWTI